MAVIFVGDRPSSKNTDPSVPFIGTPSFKTLKKWIDRLGIIEFKMVNSHGINMSLYRMNREEQLWLRSYPYNQIETDVYIALGNNASKALKDIPHFKLPHPSPKNRKLNDPKFIDSELEKCHNYIKGIK